MTVGQLIEELKLYNPALEVVISPSSSGDTFNQVGQIVSGRFIPWEEPPFYSNNGELINVSLKHRNAVGIIPRKTL